MPQLELRATGHLRHCSFRFFDMEDDSTCLLRLGMLRQKRAGRVRAIRQISLRLIPAVTMITSISCVTRDGDQNLLHSSLTLGLKQRYVDRAVQIHLPCILLTGKATGLLPCRMHGYGISRLPGFIALFLPDPRRVDPCDCDRPMGRNASHRHSRLGQIRATLRASDLPGTSRKERQTKQTYQGMFGDLSFHVRVYSGFSEEAEIRHFNIADTPDNDRVFTLWWSPGQGSEGKSAALR
jgi:hypothetical protein